MDGTPGMVTKAIVFGAILLGSLGKKSKLFGLRFSLKEVIR